MRKINSGVEIPVRTRAVILGVILVLMLVAGLNPREYPSLNQVSLSSGCPGLVFIAHGVAYTKPFISKLDAAAIAKNGMTTEIAVKLVESTDQFGAIAVFHNGDDDSQWFLGQWRSYIILMNGDDYSYKRRLPRIAVDTSKLATNEFLLTITSNLAGSTFYLNGERFSKKAGFVQALPVGGRLVLGNSVYGKKPWRGTISSLAFYKAAFGPKSIRDRFAEWKQSGEYLPNESEERWLLYRFDEDKGTRVLDHSGHEIHLDIPEETTILKRTFLSRNLDLPLVEQLTTWDAGLNLFGFLPLGLVLASLLAARGIRRRLFLLIVVTSAGFGLSIGIEFIQVWMPARSSTVLDLALNTTGAMAGALFYCLLLSGRGFLEPASVAPGTDNSTAADPISTDE